MGTLIFENVIINEIDLLLQKLSTSTDTRKCYSFEECSASFFDYYEHNFFYLINMNDAA
jgi:hypothetical protein